MLMDLLDMLILRRRSFDERHPEVKSCALAWGALRFEAAGVGAHEGLCDRKTHA